MLASLSGRCLQLQQHHHARPPIHTDTVYSMASRCASSSTAAPNRPKTIHGGEEACWMPHSCHPCPTAPGLSAIAHLQQQATGVLQMPTRTSPCACTETHCSAGCHVLAWGQRRLPPQLYTSASTSCTYKGTVQLWLSRPPPFELYLKGSISRRAQGAVPMTS